MFLLAYVSPLTSVLHHEIGLVQFGVIENCRYCVTECSLTSQPWLPTNVVTILKIDIDDITQTFNFLLKGKVIVMRLDSTISTDCSALTNTLAEHTCYYCDCSVPVSKDTSLFLVFQRLCTFLRCKQGRGETV